MLSSTFSVIARLGLTRLFLRSGLTGVNLGFSDTGLGEAADSWIGGLSVSTFSTVSTVSTPDDWRRALKRLSASSLES